MPVFDYSRERQMLIEIYRARQSNIATFSYVQSPFTGKVLWSCPSIGYPIPYATQLTNPSQVERKNGGNGVVSQAEPNGLYSPTTAAGTWVPCADKQGRITPIYEERDVTAFPFPMEEQNGTLVPVAGAQASYSISAGKP